MQTSDSYLVMERMIQSGEVLLSELERLLDLLEAQGMISKSEHQVLLELGWKINVDKTLQ